MKIPSCFILIYFNYVKLANSENCFKSICIPSGYDKTVKPENTIKYEQDYWLNFTNEILVDFENILILGINEKESTISLKLRLSLWWEEPRITLLANATKEDIDILKEPGIYLPKKFTDDLWLPDAYIENVHKINKFNLISDYQTFYYGLYDDDDEDYDHSWFLYQNEVEIDMSCRMNFESYPMDEQICYFLIGSPKELEISGQLFSVSIFRFNKSQQVASQGYRLDINELSDYKELSLDGDFHFQRTGFEIKFHHSFWKYLMNYYIPSGILVILSWVSDRK